MSNGPVARKVPQKQSFKLIDFGGKQKNPLRLQNPETLKDDVYTDQSASGQEDYN
jgi:hypothetical protein